MSRIDLIAPAGGVLSSARDLSRWIRFLLGGGQLDGKRLMEKAVLIETLRSQIPINDHVGYGLGWFVSSWHGEPIVTHGGDLPGFSSWLTLLPKSDLGVAVLMNAPQSAQASVFASHALDIFASARMRGRITETGNPMNDQDFANDASSPEPAR